jgi:GH35 family endo-1,4-beta-xylanase
MSNFTKEKELEVLNNVNQNIEKHRKGYLTIRVTDTNGKTVPNVKVEFKQISHDFLFGANLNRFFGFSAQQMNDRYNKYFTDLFNFATVSTLIWGLYEPVKDQKQEQYVRFIVDFMKNEGIKLKAHSPVWGLSYTYPSWNKKPTLQNFKDRISDLYTKYPDIEYWDLVNEPSHYPEFKIENLHPHAKSINPLPKIIINDFGMFDILSGNKDLFYDYIVQKINNKIPFDEIGLQPHVEIDECTPLNVVNDVINKYGSLGKKIHISEFMPMTTGNNVLVSNWRGKWNEETHANYAVDYYKVCFANPHVKAITWWDFSDADPTSPSWRYDGGMLTYDANPKLVYQKIYNLIKNEWNSKEVINTNNFGTATSKCFYGKYEIAVTYNNKKTTEVINFDKSDIVDYKTVDIRVQAKSSVFSRWFKFF